MKKLVSVLVVGLVLVGWGGMAFGAGEGVVTATSMSRQFTITNGGAPVTLPRDTDGVDISKIARGDKFAIFYTITGSGTMKLEYLVSSDGTNFMEPTSAPDIGTTISAGSDAIAFTPVAAPFLQIKVSEDGGADLGVSWIDLVTK